MGRQAPEPKKAFRPNHTYLAADDTAGPNYIRQTTVNSRYEQLEL
jgi:hypothetical protein